jgi:hypothetical protein
MQRKLQALQSLGNAYKYARAEFSNYKSANGEGHFSIWSGTTGGSSVVAITAGDNDGRSVLGLSTVTAEAGTTYHTGTSTANNAAYTGTVTTSGTYGGMFDEEYYVVISNDVLVSSSADGGNTYTGTLVAGGDWCGDSAASYAVTIDASGGKEVQNAGTGSVPTFTANDSGAYNDDVSTGQELLYSDGWYYLGEYGAKVKFSDAQFGDGDAFTVACAVSTDAGDGSSSCAVASAAFIWSSTRGDDATSASSCNTTLTAVGTKGVQIAWSDSGQLTAKDAWRIICRAPQPEAYAVTNVAYGNVTVTTNSPVKVHQFEIMSGAVQLSNVKFSLYSHGTFSHHDAGDSDTEFHFGTVGAGHRADGASGAGTGVEWHTSVTASDISNNKTGGNTGAPTYLWASKLDMAVVADADSAEIVGNDELVGDFVFTAIKLGASETGSNSSVVYRSYFDYS